MLLPRKPSTQENIPGLDRNTSCEVRGKRHRYQRQQTRFERQKFVEYGMASPFKTIFNDFKPLPPKRKIKVTNKLKDANKYNQNHTLTQLFNKPARSNNTNDSIDSIISNKKQSPTNTMDEQKQSPSNTSTNLEEQIYEYLNQNYRKDPNYSFYIKPSSIATIILIGIHWFIKGNKSKTTKLKEFHISKNVLHEILLHLNKQINNVTINVCVVLFVVFYISL